MSRQHDGEETQRGFWGERGSTITTLKLCYDKGFKYVEIKNYRQRERDRERERERERQRQRETEKQKKEERERERQTDRQIDRKKRR